MVLTEVVYQKDHFKTKVIYGETFASTLPSLDTANQHVVIIANQRYYDLFSDKINQLLLRHAKVDWYICMNQTHCNTMEEMQSLLTFLTRFSQEEEYLFLAFGNEGVVDLTSYIQKNSVLKSRFWMIPVSVRSFAQGLTEVTLIFSQKEEPVLQTKNMPELILYDQTLTQDQSTGKMVDLLIFIVCGIVCSRGFLRDLYFNYPTRKNLQNTPFTGMLESMIRFYQQSGAEIEGYGSVFERAFFYTEGSHLLSSSMKRMLGILFHFKWNINIGQLSFNYRNFLLWLKQLGYPLELPKEFLVSDYAESVMRVMKKGEQLLVLNKVGEIGEPRKATGEELLQTIQQYQQLVEEINK